MAHCEKLGQVVSTQKSPNQIAAVPSEATALEQDAARRPAIERERAMMGLEPRYDNASPTASSPNKTEPESIFATQFSKMSKIMEDILESNKRNRFSQAQAPSHAGQSDTAQIYPATASAASAYQHDIQSRPGGNIEPIRPSNPAENVAPSPQQTTNNDEQAPDLSGGAPALNRGLPGGGFPTSGGPGVKQPGLANSRWVTPEQRAAVRPQPPPSLQPGHRMASGLNGYNLPQAVAQAQTLAQPEHLSIRSAASTEPSGRAANGRASDREKTGALPAGQAWW